MPPEAPQPRLMRGRQQFEHEQQNQEVGRRHVLVEDRLDDAIADAVDIGMAEQRA